MKRPGPGRTKKRPNVVAVRPDATLTDAAGALAAADVGCLMVLGPGGKLAGVLSERDFVTRVLSRGLDPNTTTVGEVMTPRVVSVPAATPMARIEQLMNLHSVRHLPVTGGGRVVGMVSSRDVIGHQVRTSQAKQAAAEQVAMLSTSLRNLDFDDVAEMIVREVPRVFSAQRSAACLNRGRAAGKKGMVLKTHHCLCPEPKIADRCDVRRSARTGKAAAGALPAACRHGRCGGQSIVIPINLGVFGRTHRGAAALNFVCMCDINEDLADEVVTYKASLVCEVLSYNLSHARVWQEAKTLSLVDSLTGAATRASLEEALEAETARALRNCRPYSLVMIDVDRFKLINDNLGHQVGDRVLAELCECLRGEKRVTDVLVRYGGDELVLLLPETNLSHAVCVMERIRLKIKAIRVDRSYPVTISAGVAEFAPPCSLTPNELLRRADMALFRAKRLGRDRIEVWNEAAEKGLAARAEPPQLQSFRDHVAALSARSRDFFIQSVHGLVHALEARDPYTRSHSDNVLHYALAIARTMGLPGVELETVRIAAMIHDIGKLGVPDSVLLKPGRLTAGERAVMEEHPLIAVRILDPMRFLDRELPAVRHHHERWDGGGYPDRLAGRRIPLEARVLAVADAFDAMTSTRAYHHARTVDQAQQVVQKCAGTQFDPAVTAALCKWLQSMRRRHKGHGALTVAEILRHLAVANAA